MNDNYLQHRQEITIAVNDADFNGQIKPGAIMGYFQDIATEHAALLGLGMSDMLARKLGWVMIRMSFKVLKSPDIGEVLTIQTFPEKPKAVDVNRGYYIYNQAGEMVICGSSKWCALDMETQKLQRCAALFERFDAADYIPHEPFEDANGKIEALADCGAPIEGPYLFTVQVTDLDLNFHMNNARYGDVLLNVCGVEMLKTSVLARVDLNFMSQLFIGDRYEVYKAQKENVTWIEAKKTDTDVIVFRVRAEWNQR